MIGNGLQQSIYKLVVDATLCQVWLERNARIFKRMQRDVHSVLAMVLADLRSYLSSWRKVKCSVKNQRLCSLWNLYPNIFFFFCQSRRAVEVVVGGLGFIFCLM